MILPLGKIDRLNPLIGSVGWTIAIVGMIITAGFSRAASPLSTSKPSPVAAVDLVKMPQSLQNHNNTTTINDQLADDLDSFGTLNDEHKKTNESDRVLNGSNDPDSHNNKTHVTSPVESFKARHKFKLIGGATNNDTIQLSLPRWFNYELYKSKYNKNYAAILNGSDRIADSKRSKIYLQTALKVLDYRARFRANKTSSLVFINELSDLTSDDVVEITSADRSSIQNDSLARRDNCCSYDEAIKKIKLYYRLSDDQLRRAIIDEISEKPMPVRGGLAGKQQRGRAKGRDEALDQQQFPFSRSVYYSKYKQIYYNKDKNKRNNSSTPTTLTTTTTTTSTTTSPVDTAKSIVEPTTRGQPQQANDDVGAGPRGAKQAHKSSDGASDLARLGDLRVDQKSGAISIDNSSGPVAKVKREPATMIYENKTRTASQRQDKDVSAANEGDKLNKIDIDKGPWAPNKGLAGGDTEPLVVSELAEPPQTAATERAVAVALGKNNGLLETGLEDDASSYGGHDNIGDNNGTAVRGDADSLESSRIQQAIQDQIVEQMKSQMGEQLRSTFSQHFGRPVAVRPMQFFTATTTPFPEGVLPPFIHQQQQQQQPSRQSI